MRKVRSTPIRSNWGIDSSSQAARAPGHCLLGDLGASGDYRLETLVHEKLDEAQGQMTRRQLRQVLGGRISGKKLDRVLTAMERNGIVRQVLEPASRGTTRVVRLI